MKNTIVINQLKNWSNVLLILANGKTLDEVYLQWSYVRGLQNRLPSESSKSYYKIRKLVERKRAVYQELLDRLYALTVEKDDKRPLDYEQVLRDFSGKL